MGSLPKTYLAAYNLAQSAGWAWALVNITLHGIRHGQLAGVYGVAGSTVSFFQALSFLEVVHAAVGLVRGSPLTALMQWAGRSHILFALLHCIPELQETVAATAMLRAWAISEVIRYPWYAAQVLGRYTAFIALYPIGVIGEIIIMYSSIQIVKRRHLHSVAMPNALNFAFDYHLFLEGLLLVYPFLWYQLYSFLLTQRKRKLGAEPAGPASVEQAGKTD
ncbi:hypothetical protein WJX72_005499 [[Myrmecia] bisecta]|uniref:Very-long-chain (3R)-3-hydroxyacyl-CoA dehydratase n=1 Tax=[Myrmecia] bisecta TaxID=41462 RepID=A0AAW1PEF6_9CHLO